MSWRYELYYWTPIDIIPSQRLCLEHWKDVVNEYFTERAKVKITLWKDNQRNEAKPFGKSNLTLVIVV